MHQRGWTRRAVCLVLLLSQSLTACVSWHSEAAPLPEHLQQSPASDLRLWLRSGKRIDVVGPIVRMDTLHAYTHNTEPVAIPMTDLARYATRRVAVGRTLGLVLGTAFVIALFSGALNGPQGNCGSYGSC